MQNTAHRYITVIGFALATVLSHFLIINSDADETQLSEGDKWAIIIGINSYKDSSFDPLSYAVADAQSIYGLLIDEEYGGFNRVELLTDKSKKKPTRENILDALVRVEDLADADDTVLIFFSGHGLERDEISYLLPSDAKRKSVKDSGIPISRFIAALDDTKAKVQVMFFDACHAGRGLLEAEHPHPHTGSLGFSQSQFDLLGKEADGRVIFASCGPREISWEDGAKKQGVFTYYLLEALRGKADDGDHIVTVLEASKYVTEQVKQWSRLNTKKQNPRLIMYNVSGDLPLTHVPAMQQPPVPSLAPISTPDWVNNLERAYPESRYLRAKTFVEGTDSNAAQNAQSQADTAVASVIRVKIRSLIEIFESESNEESQKHIKSVMESSTNIELMGLRRRLYRDMQANRTHALAYIRWEKLNQIYASERARLKTKIKSILTEAVQDESNSRIAEAVKKYHSLYPFYDRLNEVETILLVSPAPARNPPDSLMSETDVALKLGQLLPRLVESLEEVALSLVIQLSRQAGQSPRTIIIAPLTYQNTQMSSPFGEYFALLLETQTNQVLKWTPIRLNPGEKWESSSENASPKYLLSGRYWRQGQQMKLMVALLDEDRILAKAEAVFSEELLGNLDATPQDFTEWKKQLSHVYHQNERSPFNVSVFIKEDVDPKNLHFDEQITVSVTASRQCYVRLYDVQTDGVTLRFPNGIGIDNTVGSSIQNNIYQGRIQPPSGRGFLMLVASTEPFRGLQQERSKLHEVTRLDGSTYKVTYDSVEQFVEALKAEKKRATRQKRTTQFAQSLLDYYIVPKRN
jgi:uncharacterized protein YcbK (DUF882 family)